MQLYLHDFSGFATIGSPYGEVGADGLFAYPHLGAFWTEAGHEPLLFRVAGQWAGFALLNRWAPSGRAIDHAIAEFFVMRKYRRAGIGNRAALRILADRPGWWEIAATAYNTPAQAFWRAILAGFGPEEMASADARWNGPIWRFRSGAGAGLPPSR